MKVSATSHSTECQGQKSCKARTAIEALPSYGATRLLARRTEPVEHRSVLKRFKAFVLRVMKRVRCSDLGFTAPRQIEAALESPLTVNTYKALVSEGGPLNTLYFGLIDVELGGNEEFSGRATALFDQPIKGIPARDWAMGSPSADRKVVERAIRRDPAHELNTWMAMAQKFIAAADLRVIGSTKNLPRVLRCAFAGCWKRWKGCG